MAKRPNSGIAFCLKGVGIPSVHMLNRAYIKYFSHIQIEH
jgi:hypothetical protein